MESETKAVVPVVVDDPGRQVIKLKVPVKWEDLNLSELVLDLDGLSGNDLANAEAEMQLSGIVPVMVDTSKSYAIYVAAKAAHVPVGLILALRAPDCTKVTLAVQGFLMG
jgi:hypothetical protein